MQDGRVHLLKAIDLSSITRSTRLRRRQWRAAAEDEEIML
jgi:hypothetical protein